MAVKTFAAIDVGSFEISMKIFQVSKNGMKEIDHIRHEIDMGTETYSTGKLFLYRIGSMEIISSLFLVTELLSHQMTAV